MSAELQWLSDITFFNLLDEDERAVLSKQVEARRFPAGSVIFKAGDPGNSMYVIRTGSVEISLIDEDTERVVLAVFSDSDFFGELSLLDEEPRSSTAIALKDTDAVLIDREDLRLLFSQKPHAALDMLSVIGKRLRENDKLIRSRAARNANEMIDEQLTFGDRLADWMTSGIGTMKFIYFSAIWFGVWIVLNMGLIKSLAPFDPFPFGLLTMVVSLEAIFLSIFALISQNRMNAKDRVRSELDYNVNLKAELEVAQLHQKLDGVREELLEAIGVILQHEASSS
ncbi:MAG TPA: DUF1003 domain-containing protein [Anaerolineae bacterium]|nr:DUF1003 domain-containing protein [Anaerolineae bacterium]